jgi:hypothetical protein
MQSKSLEGRSIWYSPISIPKKLKQSTANDLEIIVKNRHAFNIGPKQ